MQARDAKSLKENRLRGTHWGDFYKVKIHRTLTPNAYVGSWGEGQFNIIPRLGS